MANTFKSYTSGSIGTTLVDVYTCPTSTTTIILGASIANTDTNPIGGSIKLDGTHDQELSTGDNSLVIKNLLEKKGKRLITN